MQNTESGESDYSLLRTMWGSSIGGNSNREEPRYDAKLMTPNILHSILHLRFVDLTTIYIYVMEGIADLGKPLEFSILETKTVLITGGVSGLGALMVTQFAKYGAKVTAADINEQLGKAFVQELSEKGLHINFVHTDVTDWTSQIHAFKSAIAFGQRNSIDVVVAAAGVSGGRFVVDMESPSLEKDPPLPSASDLAFDVNAKGVYFTCKLAQYYFSLPVASEDVKPLPYRKSLVVISSLAGYLEVNNTDYTASKWAVRGMFRAERSGMEDNGHRINLIAPWVMDTPMAKSVAELCRSKGFPVGDANHVADAVVRCAADESICGKGISFTMSPIFAHRACQGEL